MNAQIIRGGRARLNEGKSVIDFFTLEARHTDDEILQALDRHGVPIDGESINSAYDCTGKWFADSVRIHRRGKFRVGATQWWGLDI